MGKTKQLAIGIIMLIILVALTMVGCNKNSKGDNGNREPGNEQTESKPDNENEQVEMEVVKATDMHEGYAQRLVKQGKYDAQDGSKKDAIYFMFYLGTVKKVPMADGAQIPFEYKGGSDVMHCFNGSTIDAQEISNIAKDSVNKATSWSSEINQILEKTKEVDVNFFDKSNVVEETINSNFSSTWGGGNTISNSYTQAETTQPKSSQTMYFRKGVNKAGFYRYVKRCWVDVFATVWVDKNDLTERDENGNYKKSDKDLTFYYTKSVSPVRKVSWQIEYSKNKDFQQKAPKEKLDLNVESAKSILKARGFYCGEGTETDPYMIRTIDELSYMGAFDKDGQETYYKLANNLDATTNKDVYIKHFSGVLDGDGYSISNLEYNVNASNADKYDIIDGWDNYYQIGLIGQNDGTIKNLNIISSNIVVENIPAYYVCVGLLAGSSSKGNLDNCHVLTNCQVKVHSTTFGNHCEKVGGLVGEVGNQVTISNCSSEKVVIECENYNIDENFYYVGGLIGLVNGAINNSYATGDITCTSSNSSGNVHDYVGGLIGLANGAINNSYATGAVTFTNTNNSHVAYDYIGGLIGKTFKAVSNSYATGAVTCTSNSGGNVQDCVGGLIGRTLKAVSNSYALGAVTCTSSNNSGKVCDYIGGLIGVASGAVTDCVNIGNVLIKADNTSNVHWGKSIARKDRQTLKAYYSSSAIYDVPTTAKEYIDATNIVGKTLEEIETIDFIKNTLNFDTTIWNIVDGSMPTLFAL